MEKIKVSKSQVDAMKRVLSRGDRTPAKVIHIHADVPCLWHLEEASALNGLPLRTVAAMALFPEMLEIGLTPIEEIATMYQEALAIATQEDPYVVTQAARKEFEAERRIASNTATTIYEVISKLDIQIEGVNKGICMAEED